MDREQLLRVLDEARGAIAGGAVEERQATFGEIHDKWWAAKCARNPKSARHVYRLRPTLAWFDIWPIRLIGPAQWAEYRAARMEMPNQTGGKISAYTVTLELDFCKEMVGWAMDNDAIKHAPLSRIKREKAVVNSQAPLRERDLAPILSRAANKYHRVCVILALDGGPRVDELRRLRWPDVDPYNREITVRRTKNGKDRVVCVTSRAIDALMALPKIPGTQDIFVNVKTKRLYNVRTLGRWQKTAVVESGVEFAYGGKKIRWHALRHGYGTNAVERGVDIRAVQEQLGHSSLGTTEKYVHARREHLRRAADVFEDGIAKDLKPQRRRGPRRAEHWPPTAQEPLRKNTGST